VTAEYPAAFTVRQGNAERRTGLHQDDSDPRRPGDPPWRGRTARRSSTPAAVRAFRSARLRGGWSIGFAAGRAGISRPHLSLLERGLRRPSSSVAEAVIKALAMTPAEAEAVRSVAVQLAGKDSPYRSGWRPSPPQCNYEEGGRAVLGPRRTAPQARPEPAPPPEPAQSWGSAYMPPEDGDGGHAEPNPWAEVYGTSAEAVAAQRLEGLRSSPWRR